MGVTYTAYTVIGCEVTGGLYTTTTGPGCEHDNPTGVRFCSECGKPAYVQVATPIMGYLPEDNEIESVQDGVRLVLRVRRAGGVVHADRQIAGVSWRADYYVDDGINFGMFDAGRWDAIHALVRRVLEPLGLWRESAFGIYTILQAG